MCRFVICEFFGDRKYRFSVNNMKLYQRLVLVFDNNFVISNRKHGPLYLVKQKQTMCRAKSFPPSVKSPSTDLLSSRVLG